VRRTSMRRMRSMALMALAVALMASPARGAVKDPTVLTVERPAPVVWGDRATVTAHLRLQSGAPLGDRHVDLHIAGDVAGGRTDAAGTATFDLKTPVNPGTYYFQVTFNGTTTLLPSQAGGTLTVQPRLFTIRTVPSNPGLSFNLNGTVFVSDADGVARVQVSPTFDASLRPQAADKQVAPGVEERFARWRTHNGDIYATYEMYYQIRLAFVDLAGHPVDPGRVTKVDLKSAIGSQMSVPADSPFTVLGQRVVPLAGELQAKEVTYAAEDVVVDGASVIHVAQQRFTPSTQRVWTITLLFYSAHISVRDALFGFPIDTNVAVTYPDGRVVGMPAKDGELTLTALARGDYRVVAQGWGISFSWPVALSRDQQVELKFISYLDIGVATGLLLIVVLGLMLAGRPGMGQALRGIAWRRGAPVATAAVNRTAELVGAVARGPRVVRTMASGIFPPGSAQTRVAHVPTPVAPSAESSGAVKAPRVPRAQATRVRRPEAPEAPTDKATKVPAAQAIRDPRAQATRVQGADAPEAPMDKATKVPAAQAIRVPRAQATRVRRDKATKVPAAQAIRVPRAEPIRVPRVYVVRAGDTLRSIAATMLGDENAWPEILHANGDVVFDPDRILPGTRLRIR
jgi:nucleoid-associated protein YgaU